MATVVFIIVICILVVIMFSGTKTGKSLKARVSGTAEEMINNDASTPEGAKAYYNTAIAKREDDYNKSYSIYTQMLGKIKSYEDQLRELQKENMQLDLKINTCIEKNDDDGAKVYLKRKQEVTEKIDIIKDAIKELKDNSILQKETTDQIRTDLDDLKSEKESAILTLETAQVTKTLQADPSAFSSTEDKMLEKVRDGIKKQKEQADGNKMAYESSSTIQKQRIEKKMKEDAIDKKLQELKKSKNNI